MPFFPATRATEHEQLCEWVDAQLVNARSVVHGLTADQLRARPVPSSELTLGWLILHIGEVAETWLRNAPNCTSKMLSAARKSLWIAKCPVPSLIHNASSSSW